MLRWLEEAPGLAQRVAQKLLDVVNNKYDLLIDTLDRLVVAAIVNNAIDATSGGKVKALESSRMVIRPPAALRAWRTPSGEKIYHAMDMPMEVAFSDIPARPLSIISACTDTRAGVMVLIDMGYTKERSPMRF